MRCTSCASQSVEAFQYWDEDAVGQHRGCIAIPSRFFVGFGVDGLEEVVESFFAFGLFFFELFFHGAVNFGPIALRRVRRRDGPRLGAFPSSCYSHVPLLMGR